MENAADALKLAAFTLIFVLALSIAMITFTQARTTSEAILYTQDEKNYYSYIDETKYKNNRVVGMESIIPTMYRYYKEKFRIEFYDSNGKPLLLYNTDDVRWQEKHGNSIIYFLDLDDEATRRMNNNYGTYKEEYVDYIISESNLKNYMNKNYTFKEELGQYDTEETDDETSVDVNKVQKRIIKYTLIR